MTFKPISQRKTAFLLKLAAGLAVVAASAAVMGTSAPAAKASGINLCIGCPSQPASQGSGSASICVNSADCAHWFTYGGYWVYGPQTYFVGSTTIKRYHIYSGDLTRYWGFSDCTYYYGIVFSGCYLTLR